jgi:hypothetical protein
MAYKSSWIVFVVVLMTSNAVMAQASPDQSILDRLERLENENNILRHRVAVLEKKPAKDTISRKPEPISVVPKSFEPNTTKIPSSSFSGFYVGATGGLELSQSHAPLDAYTYANSYSNFASTLHGPETSIIFGYNGSEGTLFMGFEGRGRFSFDERSTTSSSSSSITLPQIIQTLQTDGFVPPPPQVSSVPLTLSSVQTTTYSASKTGSGDISAKIGIINFDSWLLFGQAGLGIQEFRVKTTYSNSGINCYNPVATWTTISAGYYSQSYTSCGSTGAYSSVNVTHSYDWLPYTVLGLGVEKNIGRYFVRAEAEVDDYIFRNTKINLEAFYSPAITVGAGVRF